MHSTTIYLIALLATCGCICAEEHRKRAPSGFTGVRGKKSIPDSAYTDSADNSEALTAPLKAANDASDTSVVQKRAPSGFMGMRGKKPYAYMQPWEGTFPDGLYKRAPSGFMGMRGKKTIESVGFDGFPKRAPSGFLGMRGKKDADDLYLDEKRAPQMGFFGMRGKKFYDMDTDLWTEDKRAPSGFFGMRGKKQPRQSGFFGMRGKKYPYEFRGKFVGVRGKKNEISTPDLYSNTLEALNDGRLNAGDLDLNQLMLLLTEQNEADYNDDGWVLGDNDVKP